MRVQCPNCGGPHPKWDCKSPAKVPRVEAAIPSPVSKDVTRRPVTDSQKARKKSTAAPVHQTAKSVPKAASSVGAVDRAPKAAAVDPIPFMPVSPEMSELVETMNATRQAVADAFFVPGPGQTKRGRKPLSDPTPRQLYQRELMRQRRARLKAQKEAK